MKKLMAGAMIGLGLLVATPQLATAAPSTTQVTAKVYTTKQVVKHNKAADCWTIVGKNVYNLTPWVKIHPGGAASITSMCGKNATASFTAKHNSSKTAKAALSRYKIGTVK